MLLCAFFYIVTWTEISIIAVTQRAGFDVAQKVCTASIFLMFSSSLVNPFIDGTMNLQFKLTFKNALECGYYDARSERAILYYVLFTIQTSDTSLTLATLK